MVVISVTSAMQMVYPFESAAYNTKNGEISAPVRTVSVITLSK
ncbi:MAG: hypothetical protein IPP38_08145 [Bacteroidetes bacterium]|nr:hypothetical protein [Bacteroidota bacterium]